MGSGRPLLTLPLAGAAVRSDTVLYWRGAPVTEPWQDGGRDGVASSPLLLLEFIAGCRLEPHGLKLSSARGRSPSTDPSRHLLLDSAVQSPLSFRGSQWRHCQWRPFRQRG